MIAKIVGYEENKVEKKDENGKVIGESTYKYLHCQCLEEMKGVTGVPVARLGIAYDFDIDLKTIELGAKYEIFTYYDSTFKSRKCNGLVLCK